MGLSDKDILNSIRKDKTAGIQQLFVRYYRPLVLFADEFLKDRLEAEDVVQELFVKLWEDDHLMRVTDVSLASYLFFCCEKQGDLLSAEERCLTR